MDFSETQHNTKHTIQQKTKTCQGKGVGGLIMTTHEPMVNMKNTTTINNL